MDFNFDYGADAPMRFAIPAQEQPTTRTPANVTADFLAPPLDSSPPISNPAPTRGHRGNARKRKSVLPASSIADDEEEEEEEDVLPTLPPPSKRRRPRTLHATIDPIDSPPQPSPAALRPARSVRPRKSTGKHAHARVIPRSFAECDAADQMLITLREAGSEWGPIRTRWRELTGEKTATSTLPNRYARLKSNFTVIREEDNGHLIAAKRQVEESFEAQKWDLVARVVAETGGETYAGIVLKRQYKKLMVNANCAPPEGVRDADFEVEELSDD